MKDRKKTLVIVAVAVLLATAGVSLALVLQKSTPRKRVALSWVRHPVLPFAISATEVTVAQFKACVKAGACRADTLNPICNYGKADHDRHPVNCVTYFGAEQFCAYAGGRVCTEKEWLAACSGTDGREFPYGKVFDPDACNVRPATKKVAGQARGTVPVASRPKCEGGLHGLFDMAGNVAEWVNHCQGSYCKFRGAGFISNDPVERFAACRGVCSGNDKSLKSAVVGIRCCKKLKAK